MAGKVIVITGANGGLGRALAQRFARDGELLVLLGRSLDKVREVADSLGGSVLALPCDMTSAVSIREAFARIGKVHPRIDVLINNAAIFEPFLIEEASDDEILRGLLTNLAGPILASREAIRLMGKGARILNVSSESVDLQFPHLIVYQTSKTGLEKFSRELNKELWEKGIRVSVVRAGQMMGPGASGQMQPERAMRFMQAAAANGLNLMQRGTSHYESATQVFRDLIDLPADTHIELVAFQGRRTD